VRKISIGVDTGGTFTDLVLTDSASGESRYYKLPTTGDDASRGILAGIEAILGAADAGAETVGFLGHGTTLATNAVLEGDYAPTGMVTTRGFRDVIEIGRQRRPHFFNLDVAKPTPPAPRDCRLEVAGRLAEDGAVVEPLDEAALRAAAETLRGKGVEAVAVCFLHSYANSEHEERAVEILRSVLPSVQICRSSALLNEFREFERFATTVVNASLMPVMDRYLSRFEQGAGRIGVPVAPRVMQSNGGAVSPDAVRRAPVNTFFSGPAGGVIAAARLGVAADMPDLLTFDMGGTSTDVCLIRGGAPALRNVREMAGFPVRTRTLDIHTIGAGGGSIAWVDAGGLLKVGPQSAGATPGPAAYGRGGEAPTVTDANLYLGRLNPARFLGGRMEIRLELARRAIEGLADQLGLEPARAAQGVLEIVNANMMGALRVVSVEKGEDPRDFTLMAFGGAGPMHAADVARAMGIRRVLAPPRPGLLSAQGLLMAAPRGDFSITRLVPAASGSLPALCEALDMLRRQGDAWMAGEGVSASEADFGWLVDLRYRGQAFELALPLAEPALDAAALDALVTAFHDRHEALNGYRLADQPVEVVNLRLTVRGPEPATGAAIGGATVAGDDPARIGTEQVWFPETGFVDTPAYDRIRLPAAAVFEGPAIVEQMDTTTIVPPGAVARTDRLGNLLIEMERMEGTT
jgi:N-methylhydantoinase A